MSELKTIIEEAMEENASEMLYEDNPWDNYPDESTRNSGPVEGVNVYVEDQYGGEGQGDEYYTVWKFTKEGQKKREEEKAAKKEIDSSGVWIGEIKKREVFELTIEKVLTFETMYGYMTVNLMKCGANTVVYKGNSSLGEAGDTIKVKATVKEHGEYEGVKQTIINRPVLQ